MSFGLIIFFANEDVFDELRRDLVFYRLAVQLFLVLISVTRLAEFHKTLSARVRLQVGVRSDVVFRVADFPRLEPADFARQHLLAPLRFGVSDTVHAD